MSEYRGDVDVIDQSGVGPPYAEFIADVLLRFGTKQMVADVLAVLTRRRNAVDREIADVRRKIRSQPHE